MALFQKLSRYIYFFLLPACTISEEFFGRGGGVGPCFIEPPPIYKWVLFLKSTFFPIPMIYYTPMWKQFGLCLALQFEAPKIYLLPQIFRYTLEILAQGP